MGRTPTLQSSWICAIALLVAPLASAQTSVFVAEVDPSTYTQDLGPSEAGRQSLAGTFYESNSDQYDFLIVFPAFSASFSQTDGGDAIGLHTLVRNDVFGLGLPTIDLGARYHSAARLKGYIDVGTLMPGSAVTSDSDALGVIAHEVEHQYAAHFGGDLVGRDGAHWSFFHDSNASVLYGSSWRDNHDGTFTAVESRKRYSNLDLYLMGMLGPSEVGPLKVLVPDAGQPYLSTDLPPADGVRLNATSRTLSIDDVVARAGPRLPSVSDAPHELRAAFVIAVAPGQTPTPEQLAHVERVRAAWTNEFFFLTRGRGLMTTDLTDAVPNSAGTAPGVVSGLSYLLSRQQVDGPWSDDSATLPRDTESALLALRLFSNQRTELSAAVSKARVWLAAQTPDDHDAAYRRLRALAISGAADVDGTAAALGESAPLGSVPGARGFARGYGETVLDSVLLALAVQELDSAHPWLEQATEFLAFHQNVDGGFPSLASGPSRVEVTALALQFLAKRPRSPLTLGVASSALAFLASKRGVGGLFIDDLALPSTTGQVVAALAAWDALGPTDGQAIAQALLSHQREDGSWDGSVEQTAQALRALRLLLVPNLQTTKDDVTVSIASVQEGALATARVRVHNAGFSASGPFEVQLFDSSGAAYGDPTPVSTLVPGGSTELTFTLDTKGHGGSTQLFAMSDPAGLVDETREDDNRAAILFEVRPSPQGPELFVSTDGITFDPARVSRPGDPLRVFATVGNAGLTPASTSATLFVNGQPLQAIPVSLGAQSHETVAFALAAPAAPYPAAIRVEIDASGAIAESDESNNSALTSLQATPSVDLRLSSLLVTPASTEQGGDVLVSAQVTNAGTVDAIGTSVEGVVVGADGAVVAVLSSSLLVVPAGHSQTATLFWRANRAGELTVQLRASHPLEAFPGDEELATALHVTPSSRPNLRIAYGSLGTSPNSPLAQQQAYAEATVINDGAAAPASVVEFFLGNPDAGGRSIGQVSVPSLAAGESVHVNVPFTPVDGKKVSLVARVDAASAIDEFDELDNDAAIQIEPLSIADLAIVDADLTITPAFPKSGEQVSVTVSVLNAGRQASSATQLELSLGLPDSGGTSIGKVSVPAIEPLARQSFVLAWDTTGSSGPQTLVAVVNASGESPDERADNNRATRKVLLQSAAVSVTEPYFSPNEDGVKDRTGLLYQLASAGPSMVRVVAPDGATIRSLPTNTGDAAFGSAEWDGRNDQGKLANDGEYDLVAFAGSDGEGTRLGSAHVVLDTNRYPLEEVTDPKLLRHVFPLANVSPELRVETPTPMPDGSGVVFFAPSVYDGSSYSRCGFLFQSYLGGEPTFLTPPDWDCRSANEAPRAIAISPDAKSIAYLAGVPPIDLGADSRGGRLLGYGNKAVVFSIQDKTFDVVRANPPNAGLYDEYVDDSVIAFGANSQKLYFAVGKLHYSCGWWSCGDASVEGFRLVGVDLATRESRIEFDLELTGRSWRPQLLDLKVSSAGTGAIYTYVDGYGYFYRDVSTLGQAPRLVKGENGNPLPTLDWTEGTGFVGARRARDWSSDGNYIYTTWLYTSDLQEGAGEALAVVPGDSVPVIAGSPLSRAVVVARFPGMAGNALQIARPNGSPPLAPFAEIPGATFIDRLQWLSIGTGIFGEVRRGEGEASEPWAMFSLANLTARLQASRPPGAAGITFRGTATDLNFDHYEIAVRPAGSTVAPLVVIKSNVPVSESVLGRWTPPSPGRYEATLTVSDLAGNAIRRTTQVGWTSSPAIANLRVEPSFISPNGDGRQDAAVVRYDTGGALTTQFQIADALGHVVRTFDRTHLDAGSFDFTWNGRDEAGEQVEDGAYSISAERIDTGVQVDATLPRVSVTLGSPALDGRSDAIVSGDRDKRRGEDARLYAVQVAAPEGLASIPAVKLWWHLESEDANLASQALAIGEGTAFQTAPSDGSGDGANQPIEANLLRGKRVQLTAEDRAGNVATGSADVPERLFVVGVGAASQLETPERLLLRGESIPRVDRLVPVRYSGTAQTGSLKFTKAPSSFTFSPQRYAFYVNHTIGKRIVAWSVSYPSPVTGAEVIDFANVGQLADDVIVWDARLLPERSFVATVRATDETGRTFEEPIRFLERAGVETCVNLDDSGRDTTRVSIDISEGAGKLSSGSLQLVNVATGMVETTFPTDTQGTATPNGVRYTTEIPTWERVSCEYTLRFQGHTVDGNDIVGDGHAQLCGLQRVSVNSTGNEVRVVLAESFRGAVESVDVFSDGSNGASTYLGTIPRFEGQTEYAMPASGCAAQVRLVAHLPGGGLWSSASPENGFRSCGTSDPATCVGLELTASRQGDAPLCQPQAATFAVGLSGQTATAGGWQSATAELRRAGEQPVPVPLSFTSSAGSSTLSAVASVSAANLAEGSYELVADAKDLAGSYPVKASGPVIVDRTPPVMTVGVPGPDQAFCPTVVKAANGSLVSRFEIDGFLSDDWLEEARLHVQRLDGVESADVIVQGNQPPHPVRATQLGVLDGQVLPPGQYELTGWARDASGGSVCLAPRRFRVYEGIEVFAGAAEPSAFSPDGDGAFDTTQLHYTLAGPAQVSITASRENQSWSLFEGPSGEGDQTFTWNGRSRTGENLGSGNYQIAIRATDGCARTSEATMDVAIDLEHPVARIDAPTDGSTLSAAIEVKGEATDPHFLRYRLFDGAGSPPTAWTELHSSTWPAAGRLLSVSGADLGAGAHTLRLVVEDSVGLSSEATVSFQVKQGEVLAGVAVAPSRISPNFDQRKDEAAVSVDLLSAAEVEFRLVDPAGGLVKSLLTRSLSAGRQQQKLGMLELGDVPDGSYAVEVRATSSGSFDTAQAELELDRVAPKVTIVSPAEGAFVPGTAEVNGAISDASLQSWSVVQRVNGTDLTVAGGNSDENGSLIALRGLADAAQQITISAEDDAGNVAVPVVRHFTSDSVAPVVAFKTPASGDVVSAAKAPISAQATLEEANLASVKLQAIRPNGQTIDVFESATAVNGVSAEWSSPGFEGPASLVWTATDKAGNQGRAEIPIVVDGSAPTVAITSPSGGYVTQPIWVVGTIQDTTLAEYLVEIAPAGTESFSVLSLGGSNAEYPLAELSPLPADGPYVLRVTAKDRVGQQSRASVEFTVDTHAPDAPLALAATLQRPRTVKLSWTASMASDVVGYRLYRGTKSGTLASIAQITGTSTTDTPTADGNYRYALRAVDAAGQFSEPSNEVTVAIDATPPTATIASPSTGAVVSGLLEVRGTAFASSDFKEYRLSIGEGATPTTFQRIATSSASVLAERLATIDVGTLANGALYTLRLEAEDLDGNLASAEVRITADNSPPAQPVLTEAKEAGKDVQVDWQANTESDLAGYLLFRNGIPVNAAPGASYDDLRPLLLSAASITYLDLAVPDGVALYELQAMDLAGNLSERSAPKRLVLERQAPHARFAQPATLARVSGPLDVVAEVADEDVAKVRFEVRSGNETTYTPLGKELSAFPFRVSLDPATLASAAFEIRAIATDRAGNVDAEPESVYLFRDATPAAPVLTSTVRGGQVSIAWTDTNPPSSVAGHRVLRGPYDVIGVSPLTGVASATSSAASNPPEAGYDGSVSTAWWSNGPLPQSWTLTLDRPTIVKQLWASSPIEESANVWLRVRGLWTLLARSVPLNKDVYVSPPLEVDAVRYEFVASSALNSVALSQLSIIPVMTTTETSYVQPFVSDTSPTYEVRTVTPFGLEATATVVAPVVRPQLQWPPATVGDAALSLRGSAGMKDATVEIFREGVVIGSAAADATGQFEIPVQLVAGDNVFHAISRYPVDSESFPSAEVSTRYEPRPEVGLALSLEKQDGNAASFAFSVDGDVSAVSSYQARRIGPGTTEVTVANLPSDVRTFTDSGLANGTYLYRVVALNSAGFASTPSNAIELTVALPPPAAPVLAVTAPPDGSALTLSWSAVDGAGSYVVERGSTSIGPFAERANAITANLYDDTGLENGVAWFYRVIAVDSFGNRSTPSNVASGIPRETTAPEPPRFNAPTTPGSPIYVSERVTSVRGMAEPRSRVELVRNGSVVGQTIAGDSTVTFTRVSTRYSVSSSALTSDGRSLAYLFSDGGAVSLAVEDLVTQAVQVTHDDRFNTWSVAAVSPDGKRVALLAETTDGTYESVLVLVDVPSKTWKRVVGAGAENADAVSWSADSKQVVYQGWSDRSVIGTASFDAPVENVVWSSRSAEAYQPKWAGANRVVALLSPYTSSPGSLVEWTIDASGVSERTVASFRDFDSNTLAVSGDHAVVRGSPFSYGWELQLVELSTGSIRQLTFRGFMPGAPAFSPDGTQVVFVENGLTLFDLETGGAQEIGSLNSSVSLAWTPRGIFVLDRYYPPERIDWGGPFQFDDVALGLGTNRFTAYATDASGNRSPEAQPIEVVIDTTLLCDLVPAATITPTAPVAGQPASVSLQLKNIGAGTASRIELSATLLTSSGQTRSVAYVSQARALASGATATFLVPLPIEGLSGPQQLVVVANGSGTVTESNRDNDSLTIPFTVSGSGEVSIGFAVSPSSVEASEAATAQLSLVNPGPARDLSWSLALQDSLGATVAALAANVPIALAPGETRTIETPVSAVGLLAGTYELVAEVRDGAGFLSTSRAPFTVNPDRRALVRVESSRSAYSAGIAVELSSEVTNASANELLAGASLELTVRNAQGETVAAISRPLPLLSLGSSAAFTDSVAAALAPGKYDVAARVLVEGTERAVSATQFSVEGAPFLQGAVAVLDAPGALPTVRSGAPIRIGFTVANKGTLTANGVTANVRVFEPTSTAVRQLRSVALGDLAPGAQISGEVAVPSDGWPLGTYAFALGASPVGSAETSLATGRFSIADAVAPVIAETSPLDGAFVRGSLQFDARILDDSAGVALARLEIDGQRVVLLDRSAGTPRDGRWLAPVALGSDGPHTLVVSAADAAGNDGRAMPGAKNPVVLQVVSDSTPPKVELEGVSDGGLYASPVYPAATVTDVNLASSTLTVTGKVVASGTQVSADGTYVFEASARDLAGNSTVSAVRFTVDRTSPRITVQGVAEGQVLRGPVRPVVSITDPNLELSTVFIDGQPFIEGMEVSSEQVHVLSVQAQDRAGNASALELVFTIDLTPPALTVDGVSEDEVVAAGHPVSFAATDLHLASVEGWLDGALFLSGTPLPEGAHTLHVLALDLAGNETTQELHFVADGTAARIVISGVEDGEMTKHAVSPTFEVTDAHLASSSATLNGAPFASGTPVTQDGAYRLEVTAHDVVGNAASAGLSFTIDSVAPKITFSGVEDGAYVNHAVVPVFEAIDPHLSSVVAELDGQPFLSGSSVSKEGPHSLAVTALDEAGNPADEALSFTIDRAPPEVTISGVEEGMTYSSTVIPTFTASDLALASTEAWLDEKPFASGTPVSAGGPHVLVVVARDRAGNERTVPVSFRLRQVEVEPAPADWPRVLALFRSNKCQMSPEEVLRWNGYLQARVDAVAGQLRVVTSDDAFLRELRSDQFNVFMLVQGATTTQGCANGPNDEQLRKLIAQSVEERVFLGSAGLIAVRLTRANAPLYRDVLGVDLVGNAQATQVGAWGDPFTGLTTVSTGGTTVGLKALGANLAAAYLGANTDAWAATRHRFGAGVGITFGFDPSLVSGADERQALLERALRSVVPASSANVSAPLSVVGASLVTRSSGPVDALRVVASLDPELVPVWANLGGEVDPRTGQVSWSLNLEGGDPVELRYLTRLPDQVGHFVARASVQTDTSGATDVPGVIGFDVAQTGASLLADARAQASTLSSVGSEGTARREIEQSLLRVEARSVQSAADAEANLGDLFLATEELQRLESPTALQLRITLDQLIRYWEAQWYGF